MNDLCKRGYSPLEFAVSGEGQGIQPDATIVRSLMKAGADRSLKTADGRSAEDIYRAYMKEFGAHLTADDEILKLLEGKG